MADDFYVDAGRARMQDIAAERAEALATLERAKSQGDYETAGQAVQQIANLDAERANLSNLYDQYVRSMNPPRPPEPTAEERKHRDWTRMDWQDVVDLARQSKYARDIRPDDPDLIAGWQEAQRRHGRGE